MGESAPKKRPRGPLRVLVILLGITITAAVASGFIPWRTWSMETCTRCGTTRHGSWSLFGGRESRVDERIGTWYARRIQASHEHEWVERGKGGHSIFGMSRWHCACRPHPFAQNATGIVIALDRLEKLDLDRAYWELASSDEWQDEACCAAQEFPFTGGENDGRKWWEALKARAKP